MSDDTLEKDEADITRMSMLEQWISYDSDREKRIQTLKTEKEELRAEIDRMMAAQKASTKFDRFFDGARLYLYENPNERRGQAFMNYLYLFDDPTFDMVHKSRYDPYDRESVFDEFLTFLKDLWAVSA